MTWFGCVVRSGIPTGDKQKIESQVKFYNFSQIAEHETINVHLSTGLATWNMIHRKDPKPFAEDKIKHGFLKCSLTAALSDFCQLF